MMINDSERHKLSASLLTQWLMDGHGSLKPCVMAAVYINFVDLRLMLHRYCHSDQVLLVVERIL